MPLLNFRRASCGAAVVLLALWPKAPSRAESPETQTSEPLAVHGTPGHSVAHALVDLREIAAESAAIREKREEPRQEEMPEHERPWKNLPLPPGARVLPEIRRVRPQRAGIVQSSSPPLASSFQALLDDGRLVSSRHRRRDRPEPCRDHAELSGARARPLGPRTFHHDTSLAFWSKVTGNLFVSDPHIEVRPDDGSVDRHGCRLRAGGQGILRPGWRLAGSGSGRRLATSTRSRRTRSTASSLRTFQRSASTGTGSSSRSTCTASRRPIRLRQTSNC